jgi:hypothetical protein
VRRFRGEGQPASRAPSAADMLNAMDQNLTAMERAFQLAKSGRVRDLEEIRMLLRREGYDVSQLQGPLLRLQLKRLIDDARGRPMSQPPEDDSALSRRPKREDGAPG